MNKGALGISVADVVAQLRRTADSLEMGKAKLLEFNQQISKPVSMNDMVYKFTVEVTKGPEE